MELKVWVEGVVRVVCGLSMHTSCQDVVIALAQAIGQTGRYTLTLKLRGNERQLLATDCPLQHLFQLGQLGSEAQFFLNKTGSSHSDGPDKPGPNRRLPLPRTTEPDPVKRVQPRKAFTFNLGPSAHYQEAKLNRSSSPSPAPSTVTFSNDPSTDATKEVVFRQILQQRRRLRDLEGQVEALERESWLWEQEMSTTRVPSVSVGFSDQLEELEQQLRLNEEELMYSVQWEEQMEQEMEREQDIQRQLHQIHTSIENHSGQIMELQDRSANLEHDINRTVHRQTSQPSPWQQKENRLRQELLHRQFQGKELEAVMTDMLDELQVAERMKQDRWELIEELNKELRQCNLQQFIQQTGVSHTDQTHTQPMAEVYLSTAGVIE